ncbi:S9 family peptidase [Povalibacter sp.]|uniref:S9 family peptidase n=1 Tax=Povalibacter sp. TaxID=1962978 RepID=UPI002F42839E
MRFIPTVLLVALISSVTLAAPPDSPSRKFEGRDLFGLQVATDPQIRPDGRAIAYTRVSYDIMSDRGRQSIWLIDVETGAQVPVVAGAGSHSSPRWSRDGKRLAYVSTSDEGRPQLFVRWMDTGQSARLAELTDAPGDLAWSNSGNAIAFTMFAPDDKPGLGEAPAKPEGAQWAAPLQVITDIVYRADGAGYLKPGYTHVYVVPAEGGVPRQLSFGAFNEAGPLSWSRDDRHIFCSGNRTENWRREPVNTELYRITVADTRIEAITTRIGPDGAPSVSPDGSQLAYLGFDDKLLGYSNARAYVAPVDGGEPKLLSDSLDRGIDALSWSADSRSLVIQYDDAGRTRLARLSLNGRLDPLADNLSGAGLDRPYTGGQFSVAGNGAVAFTGGTGQRPSDIFVEHRGRVRQLTRLNDDFLGSKTLGEVKPLAVKSSFDQRPVGAWLVTPPDFDRTKKYPLVLEIHGGPYAAYGPSFSTDNQLYASAGYVVLYTNPRGSTSYGEEFANLIQHAYPSHDYDDLMSAVDAAIAEGYVDADNLFVTGGSGGGVLTAWIVGKTTRFTAAATQKPVINWASTVLTTDITTYMPKYWFDKLPWEDPESYWKRSPLSLVGTVTTPTLVVVGDQDYRTPVSDSEQYYQALQLKGVPTALVKVPGASHGGLTARPSQSAAKASAIVAWFEKYRKK